jgi:hypothetical protein
LFSNIATPIFFVCVENPTLLDTLQMPHLRPRYRFQRLQLNWIPLNLCTASQGWQGAASGNNGGRQFFAAAEPAAAGTWKILMRRFKPRLIQASIDSRKSTTVQMGRGVIPWSP